MMARKQQERQQAIELQKEEKKKKEAEAYTTGKKLRDLPSDESYLSVAFVVSPMISISEAKQQVRAFYKLVSNLRTVLDRFANENPKADKYKLYTALRAKIEAQSNLETNASRRLFLESLYSALLQDVVMAKYMGLESNPLNRSEKNVELTFMREIHNTLLRHQLDMKKMGQIRREINGRFVLDSGLFAIAIGMVMLEQLVYNYGANPRAMQQHLESLKDPFAHMAFYSFMIANGYSTHYLQKVAAGAASEKMRRTLFVAAPHLAMTMGSLASQITGDLGATFKSCVGRLLATTERPATDQDMELCDSALKAWTLEGKGNQYIPTFISMLMSNGVSTIAEKEIRQGLAKAKEKVFTFANSSTSYGSNAEAIGKMKGLATADKGLIARSSLAAETQIFKYAASETAKNALKITGLRIGMMLTPGGAFATTLHMTLKVVQFSAFVYLDHVIMPFVNVAWGNTYQSNIKFKHFVSEKTERVFQNTLNRYFMDSKSPDKCKSYAVTNPMGDMPYSYSESVVDESCEGELYDVINQWRDYHAQWRASQNSEFEQAFMLWGEMLKKVTNQMSQSYLYYAGFMQSLLTSEKYRVMYAKQAKTPETENAYKNQFFTEIRAFPLYGVVVDPSYGKTKQQLLAHKAEATTRAKQEIAVNLEKAFKECLQENIGDPSICSDVSNLNVESIEVDSILEYLDDPQAYRIQFNDGYLKNPIHTEMRQSAFVKQASEHFLRHADILQNTKNMSQEELSEVSRITQIFELLNNKENDIKKQGLGLVKLNEAVFGGPKRIRSIEIHKELFAFRKSLGDPNPIFNPSMGFPFVYMINSSNQSVRHYVVPPGEKFFYERPVDYLSKQMACGPTKAEVYFVPGFDAHFKPPKVVVEDKDNSDICLPERGPENAKKAFSAKYVAEINRGQGIKYQGVMEYIRAQALPIAVGDTSKLDGFSNFQKWWIENTTPAMSEFYNNMKKDWFTIYRHLAVAIGSRKKSLTFGQALQKLGDSMKAWHLGLYTGKGPKYLSVEKEDASTSDAIKSVLRSWNTDSRLSHNLIDSLRYEITLYDRVMKNLLTYENDSKDLKSKANIINQTQKEKFDGPNNSTPNTESYRAAKMAYETFRKELEAGLRAVSKLSIDDKNLIHGMPKRDEARDLQNTIELSYGELVGAMNKLPQNEFRKKLFESTSKGYANVLGEIQKFQLASFLTDYDPKEIGNEKESETKRLGQLRNSVNPPQLHSGSRVRGGP